MKILTKIYRFNDKIEELNKRAKQGITYTDDLDIGEICYLTSLQNYIKDYRISSITFDELKIKQEQCQQQLEKYYLHCEIYNEAIEIRNRYSMLLTEATKNGCDICKKIVAVSDKRCKE